jgi:flagellar hook-associated protein 1 FlgK
MLSGAQSLVSRFQDLSDRLREIGSGVNKQIASEVTNINAMAREIAELNQRIITAEAAGGQTQPSNDLRDQRDQLMLELNKHINATAMEQKDGSYSVFFGNGQPLVVGRTANALVTAASDDDPTRMQVGMTTASGSVTMLPDTFIKGGALGGLLSFRTQSLDDTQNQLGLMAMGIASAFNDQHALGQDLSGAMGGNFFNLPTLNVIPNAQNFSPATGTVSLTLDDVSAMRASDYSLDYDGTNYTLRRLSDNTTLFTGTAAALTAAPIDGMTFAITGAPTAGDSFRLQPTRYAARDISVAITDARDIAAASPITTKTATANNGTAVISPGAVLEPVASVPSYTLNYDLASGELQGFPVGTSIDVTVNGTTTNYVIGGAVTGIPYTNGMTVEVDSDGLNGNDLQFGFTGTPQHGDSFTVGQSAANTNDNRNALALAKVQTDKVLLGGTASVESAYAQMVSLVGNKAREIDVNYESQSSLLEQAQLAVQSLSGVNLDEEAANLLRYQQAYQASAKIIDISGRLFDLLASLGG